MKKICLILIVQQQFGHYLKNAHFVMQFVLLKIHKVLNDLRGGQPLTFFDFEVLPSDISDALFGAIALLEQDVHLLLHYNTLQLICAIINENCINKNGSQPTVRPFLPCGADCLAGALAQDAAAFPKEAGQNEQDGHQRTL